MARAALAVTQLGSAGAALPANSAGTVDGHMFANDGRTIVELTNSGVAARVVTLVTPKTEGGLAVADLTVTLAAGETQHLSRLRQDLFNQPIGAVDQGMVYIDYPAGNEADVSTRVYRG